MSSGSPILLKIVSENRFSGKTFFYTIASRSGVMEAGWKTRVTGERCNDRGVKEVLFADPDLSREPIFYRKAPKLDYSHYYTLQDAAVLTEQDDKIHICLLGMQS